MLWQILRGHRSAWFEPPWFQRLLISAVICMSLRWVWHLYNLSCVSVLFWLISIARYIFKSPRICFWGTKYHVYRECVVYLHYILWRRARLRLELFASTAVKLFSRVSYLPSYVFQQWHIQHATQSTDLRNPRVKRLALRRPRVKEDCPIHTNRVGSSFW